MLRNAAAGLNQARDATPELDMSQGDYEGLVSIDMPSWGGDMSAVMMAANNMLRDTVAIAAFCKSQMFRP